MAEPVLNASRVVARVSEGVPAGVPEHVSVDREGEAGAHADGLDVTVNGIRYERAAAFGGEDEGRARGLPPRVSRWSDGWRTARAGPDVKRAGETLQDRADVPPHSAPQRRSQQTVSSSSQQSHQSRPSRDATSSQYTDARAVFRSVSLEMTACLLLG
jgi:hypothetical protein